MPSVQEIRYSEAERRQAEVTVNHALKAGGFVRTQGAWAVWKIMHAVEAADGSYVVRLEPIDPHDVPIGIPCYELPLARGPVAGTLPL